MDGKSENDGPHARFELYYPSELNHFSDQPIWTGDATAENASRILQSPVRRNLVRQILTGKSAIWVLVESGDAAKDDAAFESLVQYAKKATERLELPEGVIGKNDTQRLDNLTAGDEENILQSDVPLLVGFSVIRLSRQDFEEEVFLQMLLNLEEDLDEYADQPMAFPVFGRGRILEPLIGLGLTDDNVWAHSAYLTGACSCEAKDQNPGIDLLMAMDWEAAMEGSKVIIEKMLPPLEGTAALTQSRETMTNSRPHPNAEPGVTESDVVAKESGRPPETGFPIRPLVLVLTVVAVMLGVGTMILQKGAQGR